MWVSLNLNLWSCLCYFIKSSISVSTHHLPILWTLYNLSNISEKITTYLNKFLFKLLNFPILEQHYFCFLILSPDFTFKHLSLHVAFVFNMIREILYGHNLYFYCDHSVLHLSFMVPFLWNHNLYSGCCFIFLML